MELGNRIYYNNKTGEILYGTGDMSGAIEEIDDDIIINIFNAENQYDIKDISIIQTEYGTSKNKMAVFVNLETNEIEWKDIPKRVI